MKVLSYLQANKLACYSFTYILEKGMKSCVRDKAFITPGKKGCRTPTLSCANSPNLSSYNVMKRRARYTPKVNATLKERNSLFRKLNCYTVQLGFPGGSDSKRICLLCREFFQQSHRAHLYVSLEIELFYQKYRNM